MHFCVCVCSGEASEAGRAEQWSWERALGLLLLAGSPVQRQWPWHISTYDSGAWQPPGGAGEHDPDRRCDVRVDLGQVQEDQLRFV